MSHNITSLTDPSFKLNRRPVYDGRITCQICFVSTEKRKKKREQFQQIADLTKFKDFALRWKDTSHDYNRISHIVDWNELEKSTDKAQGHKSCKGSFFKESFLRTYEKRFKNEEADDSAVEMVDDPMEIDLNSPTRSSGRNKYEYPTAGDRCNNLQRHYVRCIQEQSSIDTNIFTRQIDEGS